MQTTIDYIPVDDQSVYAMIDIKVPYSNIEELTGTKLTEKPKYSNKGKHLMLFNDQSGSMSGRRFESMQ